jgi:Ca-activated chloride channel family protein
MRRWVLFLAIVALSSCDQSVDLRTVQLNKEGGQAIKSEQPESARQKFIEALIYDPLLAELQINLGLSYELSKDDERALQQYEGSMSLAKSEQQKFVALYNQGQLLGRLKKVDEALAKYQQALEISPSSKEVKTNIELLIQDKQSGQGQGAGENKDQNEDQNKDQKQDQNKDQKNDKDQKENQDENQKEKDQEEKTAKSSPQYKPREFKGELTPADIKKILGEIKQQEQKIRAEYNKKNDFKEQPRDKDW